MNCPDSICRLVTCPVTDDIPSYLGSYSLQSGFQYVNLPLSVPIGGGFYIVPPGTIVINLPPNPTVVSYMGCSSMVSENIPTGSTPSQILAIVADVMNQIATQEAGCNAPAPVNNPFIPGSFTNGPVTIGCGAGQGMNLIGDLPPGVTFSISGITLIGGVFSSSVSQADADTIAELYLDTLLGVVVECGWWNATQNATCCDMTVQTVAADTIFSTVSQADADAQALAQATAACPICYWNTFTSWNCPGDGTKTVAAHTYMSLVSQADADAQALAAAKAQCPPSTCQPAIDNVSWTIDTSGGSGVPGGITALRGHITLSYTSTGLNQQTDHFIHGLITNNSGSTCTYTITSSLVITLTPPSPCTGPGQPPSGIFFGDYSFAAASFSKEWNRSGDSPPCQTIVVGPTFPTSFTLPNGGSYEFGFEVQLQSGAQAGGGIAMSGTFDITTP